MSTNLEGINFMNQEPAMNGYQLSISPTPRMDAAVALKKVDANAPEVWSPEDVLEIIRAGRECEQELGLLKPSRAESFSPRMDTNGHELKAGTPRTPLTDSLRANPKGLASDWIFGECEQVELLLIQERKNHFKDVETERELKSQQRQRIANLERELAVAKETIRYCARHLKDYGLDESAPLEHLVRSAVKQLSILTKHIEPEELRECPDKRLGINEILCNEALNQLKTGGDGK